MRRVGTLVLLVVLGVGGCVASQEGSPPAEAAGAAFTPPDAAPARMPDAAAPPTVEQAGCVAAHGDYLVPMDAAASRLPAGFTPRPAPGGTHAVATFVLRACARSEVAGTVLQDTVDAWLLLRVAPPPDWTADGIELYAFVLAGRASHSEASAQFAAWGMGPLAPFDGQVVREGAGPSRALRATSSEGDLDFEAVAASSQQSFGAFTQRYLGVTPDGAVSAVDVSRAPHGAAPWGGSALRFDSPDNPFGAALAGAGRFDLWPPEAPSYSWRAVS